MTVRENGIDDPSLETVRKEIDRLASDMTQPIEDTLDTIECIVEHCQMHINGMKETMEDG